MKARSANSTATDRGFVGDSNMEYVSGPENGVCPGGNIEAEGRDERGDFTLVWKVFESIDGLEGDSLDVTITASPNGSLDISLIQIDKGDETETTGKNKIAYLYDSSYPSYDLKADRSFNVISSVVPELFNDTEVVTIDANNNTDVDIDSLRNHNVVIVSNAITATNPYVATIKEAIAYVPMLNLSTSLYETWGYGKAAEGEDNNICCSQGSDITDILRR